MAKNSSPLGPNAIYMRPVWSPADSFCVGGLLSLWASSLQSDETHGDPRSRSAIILDVSATLASRLACSPRSCDERFLILAAVFTFSTSNPNATRRLPENRCHSGLHVSFGDFHVSFWKLRISSTALCHCRIAGFAVRVDQMCSAAHSVVALQQKRFGSKAALQKMSDSRQPFAS